MRRFPLLTLSATLLAAAPAQAGVVDMTVPAARDTEPVVLTGKQLGTWAAPANQTVKLPLMDLTACQLRVDPSKIRDPREGGAEGLVAAVRRGECPEGYTPHNHYEKPEVDTGATAGTGTPAEALYGFRWDARKERFKQIPFQVDERFTRYLDNSASGFAVYSGQDQHTTYAFDREGFRFSADGPADDPCLAQPASPVATDPVAGVDHDDELAFMAFDAGPAAPSGAERPKGIAELKPVELVDPTNKAERSYVYIGRAAARKAPGHAFDASNGYVDYRRDADADLYEFSESSYDNYGNAARGVYCDKEGNVVRNADGTPKVGRRRPRDHATIKTDRYRFRYDGRWLMTDIRIKEHDEDTYGPDVVDRWKARAFQQDAASETPCCGYEEEDTNWGGSSTLLGEKVGPVRVIRETWGADSGTNVIRRETFYRDEVRQKTYLRVHPIPPLDGIYAQWDFNAGRMTKFFTPHKPSGVDVDGRNDEVFGNFDDPCNVNYDANDSATKFDKAYRSLYKQLMLCNAPYHQSVDMSDPSFNGANATLTWSVTSGPHGSIVDRYSAEPGELTPGGAAHAPLAVPYYRDDSCFDDGTGTDPGLKIRLRSANEPRTTADGMPRRCWRPSDRLPAGDDRFFQGSIATHGLHILMVAESDNARATVPLSEINAEHRMVLLPGARNGSVGERYGRGFEKPLLARVG